MGVIAAALLALFVIAIPGIASAKDSNRDRIPDRWERSHKLSLKKDQRKLDQDRDGLRNRGEWLSGTSPRDRDSDDDGVTDLKEKAGVISSFDPETGELSLTLYAGGEITGTVDDSTEVKCESDGTGGGSTDPGTDDDGTPDQGSGDAASFRGGDDDDESDDDSGHGRDEGRDHESHGDDDGTGHDEDDCAGNCSVADLAAGVEVTEATIKYTASGKVFRELEIVVTPAA
mgnify:CR=1 FL=1